MDIPASRDVLSSIWEALCLIWLPQKTLLRTPHVELLAGQTGGQCTAQGQCCSVLTGFVQEEEQETEMCAKEMQLEEFQALEVKVQSENLKDSFNPKHWVHLPSTMQMEG